MPPRRAQKRSRSPNGDQQQQDAEAAAPAAAADQPAAAPAPAPAPAAAPAAPAARGGDRRQGMADIARRRAAHFANYRVDDEDDAADGADGAANPHVGGNDARSLGPWSSAVQLANAREQAQQQRQEKLREGSGTAAAEQPTWQPSRDVSLGPRPTCAVQSLADICLAIITQYVEDVESLEGLPDIIRARIAAAACAKRCMSPTVFRLFTEGGPTEVIVQDCVQLDAEALSGALLCAATPRLQRLELGMCGRGMADATASAFAAAAAAAGGLPELRSLRLAGAYRLSDEGLQALLAVAPALRTLSLPDCSRLEGAAIAKLPQLVPELRVLDLEKCRGLEAEALAAALGGLIHLEAVMFDGIPLVSDALLEGVAAAAPLRRLSLAYCTQVTDAGLRSLAAAQPGLQELSLDGCTKVTAAGLAALAEHCKSLQCVSLRGCTKLHDDAVAPLARSGTLRSLCLNGVPLIKGTCLEDLALYCRDALEELDLSWCRAVPYAALGRLVDACPHLMRLTLWGCTQVGDAFLLGHSNDQLQVVGRGEVLQPVPAAGA